MPRRRPRSGPETGTKTPRSPCEHTRGVVAREAALVDEPAVVKATGPVWKAILEIAERRDAAMIVLGSRGLTGVRSMLLGSVSSAVVHHADRPALVIHRHSGEPSAGR
ncbi:MAG: universal stress protein [Solirubrobacteraceae bacterium]